MIQSHISFRHAWLYTIATAVLLTHACSAQSSGIAPNLPVSSVSSLEWTVILKPSANEKPNKLSDSLRKKAITMAEVISKNIASSSKRENGTEKEAADALKGIIASYLMLWYAYEIQPPRKSRSEQESWQVRRLDVINTLSNLNQNYGDKVTESWVNMMTTCRALGLPVVTLP